jgi:2-polyprenyl-3-methyl-5-hydroxy-6-metoxy-1,4-benzoquinol methylase
MESPPEYLPYQEKTDPWSSHSIIVKWLSSIPEGTKVLDVGCASGTIGRRCVDMNFHLTGLEPEPSWAEIARPYYRDMIVSTIDDTPEKFIAHQDVVILADVIEHLPDPLKVLKRITALQHNNTIYFISVPNIANIHIRISLLFGRFNYSDRGILDKTHLRFFTLSTLKDFLSDASLVVTKIQATPIPLNMVHQGYESNFLGRRIFCLLAKITQLAPTLLGYQFVVSAVRI